MIRALLLALLLAGSASAQEPAVPALYRLLLETGRYHIRHGLYTVALKDAAHVDATLTGLRAGRVQGVEDSYRKCQAERDEVAILGLEALVFSGRYSEALAEGPKMLQPVRDPGLRTRGQMALTLAGQRAFRPQPEPGTDDPFWTFVLATLRAERAQLGFAELKRAHAEALASLQAVRSWPDSSAPYLRATLAIWVDLWHEAARSADEVAEADALLDEDLQALREETLERRLVLLAARLERIARWREDARWETAGAGLAELEREADKLSALAHQTTEAERQKCALLVAELERLCRGKGDLDVLPMMAGNLKAWESDLGDLMVLGPCVNLERARWEMERPDASPDDQTRAVARLNVGFLVGLGRVLWKRNYGLDEDPRLDALEFATRLRQPGWAAAVRENARGYRSGHPDDRPAQVIAAVYELAALLALGESAEAQRLAAWTQERADAQVGEFGARGPDSVRFRRALRRLCELQLQLASQGRDTAAAAAALSGQQQRETWLLRQEALARRPEAAPLLRLRGQNEVLNAEGAPDPKSPEAALVARNKAEFFRVLADLRKSKPDFEKMLAVRPANFAQTQPLLPPDTAVLQFFPGEDALYIFLVTRDALKIERVALSGAELKKRVMAMRRGIITRDAAATEAASTRLSEALLAPFEKDLAAYPTLAFVPTGALLYVPFCALRSTHGYLVESHDCVVLTKAADFQALAQASRPPSGSLLALGNPDGTLPGAAEEARQIASSPGGRCYLGAEAGADKLNGSYRTIHLATHGVLDARDPMQSYLVLAGGPLRMPDVYGLTLPETRLVTLSACQTGLAERDPGSEVASLADAFSVAGAPTVIASLWSVEDKATQQLMTRFYRELASKPAARALREAQLSLLHGDSPAPFFWAAFSLYGDWR